VNLDLVKSCSDCPYNCCKIGPGPHKVLAPEEYLCGWSNPDGYNTKCEGLTKDGKCKYWGTNRLPIECRTHVCNNKIFTKAELEVIAGISTEQAPCDNCGALYLLGKSNGRNGAGRIWWWECEVCGFKLEWTKTARKFGKRSKKIDPKKMEEQYELMG